MTSVVLGCIAIYGRNVPLAEDWIMVSPLVGQETDLLKWLWAQNNEHRLPLQKAVYLGLLKASGGDFTMPPTDVTGSIIARLNDTCGNLIQLTQLSWRQA